MNIDEKKIDEVVLALLQLTLHDKCIAWKQFSFEVMNRLHEKVIFKTRSIKTNQSPSLMPGLNSLRNYLANIFIKTNI